MYKCFLTFFEIYVITYLEEKSSYNKSGTLNSECLPDCFSVHLIMSIFMAIIIKTTVIKIKHFYIKNHTFLYEYFLPLYCKFTHNN